MANLLEVEHLSVEYHDIGGMIDHVVNDLSFVVPRREVIGLVGESGSGKSTAVLALFNLTRGTGRIAMGRVLLEDEDLLTLPLNRLENIRGRQVALVMQNARAALNPVMRVGDLIASVFRSHNKASKEKGLERARELLRMLGINDPERRMEAFPHELSGGMAQRVVIAMALSCSPKLLIADEPTSGLDVTVQAQVLDDLRASARTVGSGLVLVTRDLGVVANYCDRVYLLHAGEVVEQASTEDLFEHPYHPAALALLSVQKRPQVQGFRLQGMAVDGRVLPRGCYLIRRCKFADEKAGCAAVHPPLRSIGSGHEVRCHRAELVHKEWQDTIGHLRRNAIVN